MICSSEVPISLESDTRAIKPVGSGTTVKSLLKILKLHKFWSKNFKSLGNLTILTVSFSLYQNFYPIRIYWPTIVILNNEEQYESIEMIEK